MSNLKKFLQLFADGGAGGSASAAGGVTGGDSAATGVTIGTDGSDANDNVPASIPRRQRGSIARRWVK